MSRGPVDPVLQAVRDLGPTISELSAKIEADRCLPPALVDDLTAAQVFQLYQPRSVGGPELHPVTAFQVCEELARADGSVGWCAQVSAAVTVFLAWIDPDALAEMAATTDGPLHIAGSARPLGTAVRTEDGYRLKGHWNYASGVRHANWFLASAFVDAKDGGQATRSMLVPIEQGEIIANWDVVGMRGTGSDDFVLDEVDVSRSRSAANHWIEQRTEPLYSPRLAMVATWAPTAGVAIGLAQGALDALADLADRSSTSSPLPLGDREDVQQAVAEAEAMTSSARAFCVEAINAAWTALTSDDAELSRAVARAQIAITHSMTEAVRVADLCFRAAGTNAISTENRLERFLRDAHTAAQHAAGQPIHKRVAGRTLLNRPTGDVGQNRQGPSTPRR